MAKMIIGVPDPLTIPDIDTIDYVEWEFSRSPTFITLLDRVTVNNPGDDLAYGYMVDDAKDIVARCRFGTEAGLTDWTSTQVTHDYVQPPTISVTKSKVSGVTTLAFNTSAFKSFNNETHVSTDWFFYDSRKVLLRSEKRSPSLTNFIPPYEIFTPGKDYQVLARHRGNKTFSNLSRASFTA